MHTAVLSPDLFPAAARHRFERITEDRKAKKSKHQWVGRARTFAQAPADPADQAAQFRRGGDRPLALTPPSPPKLSQSTCTAPVAPPDPHTAR